MSYRDKSGKYARRSTFRSVVIGIGVIVLLTGAAIVAYDKGLLTSVETVEKVVTEEVHPDWATDQDAVEAAQAVIRRKALEVELADLKSDWEVTEANFEAAKADYLAEKERLEKDLGTYWTVKANLKAEIRKTFANDPVTAVAVATAESIGLNPRAYNPEWHYRNGVKICQGSFGLMQIACVHKMDNPEELYDPEVNLAYAKRIYDDAKARLGNGWLPWGAYTDGNYRKYLAQR